MTCPVNARRAGMTDEEFWADVYPMSDPTEDDVPDVDVAIASEPCLVCGSEGACAYDAEGMPLIHALSDDS